MTREEVDRWLADYVEAWKAYDRDKIAELFADDINYRYHPGDDPIVGRDAVVQSWLGEGDHADASDRDEPDTFEAAYRAVAVDGDRAATRPAGQHRRKARETERPGAVRTGLIAEVEPFEDVERARRRRRSGATDRWPYMIPVA